MRWIRWAFALSAVCVLACSAPGAELTWGQPTPWLDCEQCYGLAAPACGMQFSCLVPGCRQCQPTACDNAWATYCQEKAKWRAFWYRVGTGAYCQRAYCDCQHPTPAMYQPSNPSLQPISDEIGDPVGPERQQGMPPLPEPVGEETTWRWTNPWLR